MENVFSPIVVLLVWVNLFELMLTLSDKSQIQFNSNRRKWNRSLFLLSKLLLGSGMSHKPQTFEDPKYEELFFKTVFFPNFTIEPTVNL